MFLRRRIGVATALVCVVYLLVRTLAPGVFADARLPGLPDKVGGAVAGSHPFAGRLLVYGRHALTAAQVDRLRAAVRGRVTAVYGGEVGVASGQRDYPVVLVQAFTVDPRAYAVAAAAPALAAELSTGLVLSRAGAALRHTTTGAVIRLADGHRLPVSAVVDDRLLGGYEMATSATVLGKQAGSAASYLLVDDAGDVRGTTQRLRAALPGTDLRIEGHTRNGFMSSADTVLTQAQIKSRFGEFALTSDGTRSLQLSLQMSPAWRSTWIVTTRLPQLGRVTCNKAIVGDLRAAMEEVTRRGLGALVHTADFQREGGCWNPRIARFGAGQLSSHAWGIAVDINVDVNPLGAVPVQDPRLVDIMARHGFTWGGRWLRPDGAHFEWRGAGA